MSLKDNHTPLLIQVLQRQLPESILSIQTTIQQIEPGFMTICAGLQTLSSSVNQIRKQACHTVELLGQETPDSPLNQLKELAGQLLGRLTGNQQNMDQCLAGLTESINGLSCLSQTGEAIDKLSRSLRIIGLNMAMECSRLTGDRETFTLFSQEINALGLSIRDAADQLKDDLKQTRRSQTHTHDAIGQGLARLTPLIEHGESQIRISTQDAGTMAREAQQRLRTTTQTFERIARHISDIVVGIQFHDITRQQLEHIVQTLAEVEQMGKTPATLEAQTGLAYLYLSLQSAHLQEVAGTIEKVRREFDNAMQQIQADINTLAGNGLSRHGDREDAFANLMQEMKRFARLMDTAAELKQEMHTAANTLSQLGERLSSHIGVIVQIKEDMDLKSINAMILSGHLGHEGRTLETLAQEVYDLSGRAGGFTKTLTDKLQANARGSQQILDSMSRKDNADATLQEQFRQCLDHLNELYQDYRQTTVTVDEQIRALTSQIDQTSQAMLFLSQLKDRLGQQSDGLKAITGHFQAYSGEVTAEQQKRLETIQRRYTMENERILHQLHVQGGPAAPRPPTRQADNTQTTATIELFDMAAQPAGEEPDGNIELF